MREFYRFDEPMLTLMKTALTFVKKRIDEYFTEKQKLVDESHRDLINQEARKETKQIEIALEYLDREMTKFIFSIPETSPIPDVINSALEEYLKDAIRAKAQTNSSYLDKKIEAIKALTSSGFLKNHKTDLFVKFFLDSREKEKENKEVFLSYSSKDKKIAAILAKKLEERGVRTFLAHDNIKITEEWRSEILKHLNHDNYLISLLTDNYEASTWGNQEAGYMMGKGGRNISLIIGQTDITKFGFLEAFQGIRVEQESIEKCVDKILELLFM